MANKSDYRDPRTNLFELLPDVLRSQTNEAVFEDIFNRYLSSPQLEQVDGYAGAPLPAGSTDRQIIEPTACRQAFQLQPLLHAKLGTINHLTSYDDILNEMGRTGVNECRLPLWGNALQFNWIPPIDLDKLVNFRDYYWFCPDDPTAPSQYITIESPCNQATQKVTAYQLTLDTFGDNFSITALSTVNQTFTVTTDLTQLFTENFVFYVTGSTNTSINNSWFTTVSSSYNVVSDTTTIVVAEAITDDSIVSGLISILELMVVFVSERNCACLMDVGWDMALWDDNQVGDILWTGGSPNLLVSISWATEAEWKTANPSLVTGSPEVIAEFALWYDTSTNELKQRGGSPLSWVVVQTNFSVIVSLVEGTHMWDYTTTCDTPSNPWTDQNKWFHKNHVTNFTVARQAEIPIIEYDFDVQLNTWTFTDFIWEYRESEFFAFAPVADDDGNRLSPDLNELLSFRYVTDSSPGTITLSPHHGDRTTEFPPGHALRISGEAGSPTNNGVYTVASVAYTTTSLTPNDELATVITVVETIASSGQSHDSVLSAGSPTFAPLVGTGGELTPNKTSINQDPFRGYNVHWLMIDQGEELPVPGPVQTSNPFTEINPLSAPTQVGSPIFAEYVISTPLDLRESYGIGKYLYAMQYTVTQSGGTVANTIFPLDSKLAGVPPASGALLGDNSIRVFVDDVQQYGTYLEKDDLTPSNFIDAIEFLSPLNEFASVRICQSEAATVDIGRALVPVRTIRDNLEYIDASTGSPPGVPIAGTGSPADILVEPQTLNLIQYRFAEQEKTLVNQYPLFDMFDCHATPLFEATPLFAYKESQDEPINVNVGKRIVVGENNDYNFTQHLIDTSDDDVEHPIIYSYQLAGDQQTIWRKGLNDEEYVPEYVDANRDPITVGDPDGCWEVSDQLYFNTEHENRECVTFSEILTHFRSILDAQNNVPGFIVPGGQAYLLSDDFNYGLGGHIKEYNDSYDTFLSSVFVNNVTPLGVIDFAHDQYENSLNTIKELYRSNVISFLTSTSLASINSLQQTITTFVIDQYELNDFFALVYGDSNTFIAGSPELGVKNWPATLPFVQLGLKHSPYIITDETTDLLQLIHHDGHRSNPALTTTTRESVIQITINTPDDRVLGVENLGVEVSTVFGSPSQPTSPPNVYSVLESVITPRAGIYWYDTGDPDRVLYRFSVSGVGAIAPSGAPTGALWYDTSTDTLMELQSTSFWEPVETGGSPSVGSGIITAAWEIIDVDELLINTLLVVEERLYAAAPDLTELSFDVDSVRSTAISCPTASTVVNEDDTTDLYFEQAYLNYLIDQQISDPFSADQFFQLSDPFTWNYTFSTTLTPPVAGAVWPGSPATMVPVGGWWLDLYENIYGTSYPHLEPWKLHGYVDKPSWWDGEYLNDEPDKYGQRRWKYTQRNGGGSPIVFTVGSPLIAFGGSPAAIRQGMWENIRLGIVPIGQLLPDGITLSTGATGEAWLRGASWKYFSVNIDDAAVDGYEPDDVFPPFWDFTSFTAQAGGAPFFNRSIFSTFATEIVLPSADYTFETGAPSWVAWEESSQRLYDNLTVGYRMQPIRFMHNTFGVEFIEVAGKQINTDTCRVYSHKDVEFHGDIVNTNEVLVFQGTNQWYVNFNRFSGFDVSASDFRPLWKDWNPLLTYQFGSIIDTQTFQISNRNFDITERDYQILIKRSPGIEDQFLDAFAVTVLDSPNQLASIDTQSLWKFQVDTFFPTTRNISYYEVHNYPVSVNTITNEFTVYQFEIVDVDALAGTFTLLGDQTNAFTTSLNFIVSRSDSGSPTASNDGSYAATEVVFDTITDRTTVFTGGVLPSTVVAGVLTTSYRTPPWETGDRIELTSTRLVPSPLRADTAYFVIKIDDGVFQLAATASDAQSGTPINVASTGSGVVHAGQVFSKFVALDGAITSREWNHYVIDTRFTRSLVPPSRITGVQAIINLVDGYSVITSEEGWDVNFEAFEQDSDSGNPITWQLETERFIDQIFRIPRQQSSQPDFYSITVDPTTNIFTFGAIEAAWTTGTKIQFTSSASLPAPLLANQNYFVIRDSASNFRVALNAADAINENELDIIGGAGVDFSAYIPQTPANRHPAIEINPFRNNVWIQNTQGILSNIVEGPSMDIRNAQLVTDQNGKQLTNADLSVFRWDKISRIYVPEPIRNPTVPLSQTTEYNTLHMSGMHLFFDGYECVLIFNDRSIENILIYDPFVGLNTSRFFMQFFRQDEFTQRPNVGGYFLTPDDEILRNIEASTKDLENIYDTFRVLETTPLIKEGRRSIGYNGPGSLSYLDNIGLNPKSQLLFWRGMIQSKGSVNAIDAFTNNVLFDDAIVDEYWAYKIAEFGTNYEQEYPALNLFVEDSQRSEKRFEFLEPGQLVGAADQTFEGILTSNQNRWHDQPDVLTALEDNNLSMYFDAEITSVQPFTAGTLEAGSPITTTYYVEADVPFDDVVILHVGTEPDKLVKELVQGVDYSIVNSKLVSFSSDPSGLLTGSPIGQEYRLYTINPAKQKINPTKVIDFKSDVVIAEVPVWDPGRGHQYHIGNNLVNFENERDPASYTNAFDLSKIDSEFWNDPETNLTWWDTSERGYLPYYDHNIFELDDRIQNWGKLADWADVKLYQWTESNILPTEWNAVAAVEELNFSIDPQIRKSGTVRLETSQRTRVPFDVVGAFPSTYPILGSPEVDIANCIAVSDPTDQLLVNDRIVFTTDDELPLPLVSSTFYFILSIEEGGGGSPGIRNIKVSLEEGGDVLEITPGPLFIDVSGHSLDTGSPVGTGLVNNFDTAGLQDVSYSATKSLSSGTGLALGTEGHQEVDFSIGISIGTFTGLPSGDGGSQTITFAGGSPWICGLGTGLTGGTFYGITISVDGGIPLALYINGTAAGSYTGIASQISSLLAGGAASCNSGTGITVTSNSSGPGSTIDIVDGAPFVAGLLASVAHTPSIGTAIPGTDSPTYEATVAVNGGTAQTIEISGAVAVTFDNLITEMNNQLTGAITTISGGDLRVTSSTTGISSSVDIVDVDLFSSMHVGGGSPDSGIIQLAVAGTGTTYFQNFAINGGGTQLFSVVGDDAQTFTTLINALNLGITGATVTLTTNDEIRITSESTGIGSSVDILVGGSPSLFASMLDFSAIEIPIDGVDATSYSATIDLGNGERLVTVIGNQAQTFADLIDEINSQLTSGFIASTISGDLQITAGNNTVSVVDVPGTGSPETPLFASLTGFVSPFIPLNTGEGSHQIVPPFRDDAWVQLETAQKDLIDARDKNNASEFNLLVAGSPTINGITAGDVVDIYKNGFLHDSDITVGISGLTVIADTLPQDFITALKPKHVLTDEETAFDPDVSDDGTNLIQYKQDTNFSQTFTVNDLGVQVPVYYFWVENKSTRQGDNTSMRDAVNLLENTPTPYTIFDKLTDATFAGSPLVLVVPKRYTQLIVRGLAGIVDDTDRYELRFTRDFTLRDDLIERNYTTDLPAAFSRVDQEPLDLKTLYTEWTLIREKQPFNITRGLWDKVTESIIARKLDNAAERVPSLSRELYDITFDAQTRYGLRDQQAFVDGALALATVIDDLEDPDNDFQPVNISSFFASHAFDTEIGIIDAMDNIYNTFPSEAVNRIWFKILFDAFTTKAKYPDIFKTSWVSLSGSQVFLTETLFNG